MVVVKSDVSQLYSIQQLDGLAANQPYSSTIELKLARVNAIIATYLRWGLLREIAAEGLPCFVLETLFG